jgi:hypothetical protein
MKVVVLSCLMLVVKVEFLICNILKLTNTTTIMSLSSDNNNNNVSLNDIAEINKRLNDQQKLINLLLKEVSRLKGANIQPKVVDPRKQSINNAFKSMYVENPELAMKIFGIKQEWIEKVQNAPLGSGEDEEMVKKHCIANMSDPIKKAKMTALMLWTAYFGTEEAKIEAKEAYNAYLSTL